MSKLSDIQTSVDANGRDLVAIQEHLGLVEVEDELQPPLEFPGWINEANDHYRAGRGFERALTEIREEKGESFAS